MHNDKLSAPSFFQRVVAEDGIRYWHSYFTNELDELNLQIERFTIKLSELQFQLADFKAFFAEGKISANKKEDGKI